MTALKEFTRLEAAGLWRPSPEAQRRDVIISLGEATLTISDMQERVLGHWSLAAIERRNPGQFPALYGPDGDPGECLELPESEDTMIGAIEKLRHAISRKRPQPGRLRWMTLGGLAVLLLALALFWLPGALVRYTASLVPESQRAEIGNTILTRIERVTGQACQTGDTGAILDKLAARTGAERLIVLGAGVQDSLHMPGGIILLNRALIEDHEDPAVVAGYILSERARVGLEDPLVRMLRSAGMRASLGLLTTGTLSASAIDRYAETLLTKPRPDLPVEPLLSAFEAAQIPSTPYAYAKDITGETTLPLIEADPMAGSDPGPLLPDRDWVILQSICGG